MSSPLAVLGGVFDPVHKGHVAAAKHAMDYLGLERLKMIPCHVPNHKAMPNTQAKHRLAMLELATSDCEGIEVDAMELDRDRVSYTVDTLAELRKGFDTLVFVLGMDSFNSLPDWHDWPRILELSHLLVLSRPGSVLSKDTLKLIAGRERLVASPAELFAGPPGRILHSDDLNIDMASTSIRRSLEGGAEDSAELAGSVMKYIRDNGLYQKT